MCKFYNVINCFFLDEIFCAEFYAMYLRIIVYIYGKIVTEVLLNHTDFFSIRIGENNVVQFYYLVC